MTRKAQTKLKILGFYTGAVDGVKGKRTSLAIRNWKMSRGMASPDDGLTEQQLGTLLAEAI